VIKTVVRAASFIISGLPFIGLHVHTSEERSSRCLYSGSTNRDAIIHLSISNNLFCKTSNYIDYLIETRKMDFYSTIGLFNASYD